jgi:hypothetical protein
MEHVNKPFTKEASIRNGKKMAKDLGEGLVGSVVSITGIAGTVFTIVVGVKLGLLVAAAVISIITPKS